jgi:hypothetical protein
MDCSTRRERADIRSGAARKANADRRVEYTDAYVPASGYRGAWLGMMSLRARMGGNALGSLSGSVLRTSWRNASERTGGRLGDMHRVVQSVILLVVVVTLFALPASAEARTCSGTASPDAALLYKHLQAFGVNCSTARRVMAGFARGYGRGDTSPSGFHCRVTSHTSSSSRQHCVRGRQLVVFDAYGG